MNNLAPIEHRTSNRRSTHERESSYLLCDRLGRTRDVSQRQLPTDRDYATSTREYQTDQSSFKSAPAVADPVLENGNKNDNPIDSRVLTASLHISKSARHAFRNSSARIR